MIKPNVLIVMVHPYQSKVCVSLTFVLHFELPYFITNCGSFSSLLLLLVCRDLLPSYPQLRLVSSILFGFYLRHFCVFQLFILLF